MTHAALIALTNNESFFNITEMLETFAANAEQVSIYLIKLLVEFAEYVVVKYTETFGNNHWSAILILLIILNSVTEIIISKRYPDHLKELEDQIRYIKNKLRNQEGNMEFIFDNYANNELKLAKLTKQIKKLQKEINEYA